MKGANRTIARFDTTVTADMGNDGPNGPDLSYTYDAAGQRASKTTDSVTTWYIRDAQGNTLAIYDNKNGHVNWREQDLYGSSRLGMWLPNVNLADSNAQTVWDTIGHKRYELDNHLGNVLATITDKPTLDTAGTGFHFPQVTNAQEYFAFGFQIPGRNYTLNTNYRYGFNGKENDNEVKLDWDGNQIPGAQQDYGNRIYDPRVGRWNVVDKYAEHPDQINLSPYAYVGNNPIDHTDPDGNCPPCDVSGDGDSEDLVRPTTDHYRHEHSVLAAIHDVAYAIVDFTGLKDVENSVGHLGDKNVPTKAKVDRVVQATVNVLSIGEEGEDEGFHKNSNDYVGHQGVYEIKIDGEVQKYGKADMTNTSKTTG